jgi:hypothetical protein
MSVQECALCGELVLYLRDRAAELLAGDDGDVDAEKAGWMRWPTGLLPALADRRQIMSSEPARRLPWIH